jgi:group I intron endonuclease
MSVVYMATSPSGKRYVGITSVELKKRIAAHCSSASAGSKYPFHRAIRKYGSKSILWEIIAKDISIDEAKKIERETIAEMQLITYGYNATRGGEGVSRRWTKKQRLEMSKKKIRDCASKEYRDALSKSCLASMSKDRLSSMSQITKRLWTEKKYRAKQVASAKLRSNPDEMRQRGAVGIKVRQNKIIQFMVCAGDVVIWRGKSKQNCAESLGIRERSVYRYLRGQRSHKRFKFLEEPCTNVG